MIVAGFISADRIEAGTITVDKVTSNFGATIDLSKNHSIQSIVESTIKKSPVAPVKPKLNDLWLDTSNPEQDALKRWDGEKWVECTLSQRELESIKGTISNNRTEINQQNNAIQTKVSSEQYRTDMENKADVDWVAQQKESILKQTDSDITFQFNQSKKYVEEATGPFQEFMVETKSYQRFSPEGLEIGEIGNPFIMKLSKNRLSFLQDGQEVAYVSNNRMYITEGRVTQRLSVGTETNGYFDWTTLPTGMALKWRG